MSKVRKIQDTGNRVCPIVGQDKVLNEVQRLDIGWPRGLSRVCLLCLVVFAVSFRYYDFHSTGRGFQWDDSFTGAMIDGFLVGALLSVLPILGWTPWQWGGVTVDQQELRVPRMLKVLVFERSEKTQILTQSGFGGGYFLCLIQDDTKSAQFYVNERTLKFLCIWASYPDLVASSQDGV